MSCGLVRVLAFFVMKKRVCRFSAVFVMAVLYWPRGPGPGAPTSEQEQT